MAAASNRRLRAAPHKRMGLNAGKAIVAKIEDGWTEGRWHSIAPNAVNDFAGL
ncbi:MAG: hypothetical protein H8E30_11065 [Alphaproteobacteria bacterium]|nr:hypothetical protein [Alphaproteobacteria bacterium]